MVTNTVARAVQWTRTARCPGWHLLTQHPWGRKASSADSGPWPLTSSRAREMALSANFKERKEEDLVCFSFLF